MRANISFIPEPRSCCELLCFKPNLLKVHKNDERDFIVEILVNQDKKTTLRSFVFASEVILDHVYVSYGQLKLRLCHVDVHVHLDCCACHDEFCTWVIDLCTRVLKGLPICTVHV